MNKLIQFFKINKKEKELDYLISNWYRRLFVLSNLDEKGFIKIVKYHFLNEYEIFKMTMLIPDLEYLIKSKQIQNSKTPKILLETRRIKQQSRINNH